METAQRKSAIQELKWEQVDFATLLIKFNPDGRIQTQKRRPTLPISEKLLVMLQIAYEERINDYVLDVKTDVHYGVKRIFEDLGIETASPHTFRHTFATHRITEGVPIDKVAMFLGDEENTVRKNYAHLQPDYLREVIEQKSKSQNAFFRS
jgi:integrase